MEYFYTPPQCISHERLTIEGDEFAHLTHVMRKHAGDAIRVVDGIGNAFDVTIDEIAKRSAVCSMQASHVRLHEPDTSVTLAVSLLKNSSSFDFLVEKCTELGVISIIPLLTERTIPRHAKTERWQKLALAAMKQCGRCVLPTVADAQSFDEFIRRAPQSALRLIPHEKDESTPISKVMERVDTSVLIAIGPEGGFSEHEIAVASQVGFIPVNLGKRRLRTETAAIVATAALLVP
jgi:16S rRNA (uracil1498-N3)-methyltransferase